MSEQKFPPRLNVVLKHGNYWAACEVGRSLFIPADAEYSPHQYISISEHQHILGEKDKQIERLREAAQELIDEIDG